MSAEQSVPEGTGLDGHSARVRRMNVARSTSRSNTARTLETASSVASPHRQSNGRRP